MSTTKVHQIDRNTTDVDARRLVKGESRPAGLIDFHHPRPGLLRRDNVGARLLKPDVGAAVISMIVGVDDIPDRLVGHRSQQLHDAVEVSLELVVDQQHAFVRNQRGRVPGHALVVDDIEIIVELNQLQLGGRRLPMGSSDIQS